MCSRGALLGEWHPYEITAVEFFDSLLDDDEFILFLSRVTKYALSQSNNPKGVDTQKFISAVKSAKFTTEQEDKWIERLLQTHEAQRSLLFLTLHGVYCDPASSEEARLNALSVCERCVSEFTPSTQSELIDRHSEYVAQGKTDRQTASQTFLRRIGLLSILTAPERHSLITKACKNLLSVHQSFDNFYNEPPFAERLLELSSQGAVPETAQVEFVQTVATCATGNQYGISHAAYPHYAKMIQNFSPREIGILLDSPSKQNLLATRIKVYRACKDRFRAIVKLIDAKSVAPSQVVLYRQWT